MKCVAVIDRVKARVAAVDPNGERKLVGIFQFNIECAEGMKPWVVDLKDLKVYEGTVDGADVTVDVHDDILAAYGAKTITLDEAKAKGEFKATGNQEMIVKLGELLRQLASS